MAHIEFVSTIPGLELAWPVLPTSQLSPCDRRKHPMHVCPGIHDWNNSGYIIRAWTEIHCEAQGDDVSITVNDREHDFSHGKTGSLDNKLVPLHFDQVAPNVRKIELPWLIRTKPGYSCILTSPFYHFLDNEPYITTYPGVVDTDGLHRPSWVFSVRKKEHFVIPRGTPILQVIPFKREAFNSKVVRGDLGDWLGQSLKMTRMVKNWYWKTFHAKKVFK
jgi:hypothetical protein